jgi:hypothetical protein
MNKARIYSNLAALIAVMMVSFLSTFAAAYELVLLPEHGLDGSPSPILVIIASWRGRSIRRWR